MTPRNSGKASWRLTWVVTLLIIYILLLSYDFLFITTNIYCRSFFVFFFFYEEIMISIFLFRLLSSYYYYYYYCWFPYRFIALRIVIARQSVKKMSLSTFFLVGFELSWLDVTRHNTHRSLICSLAFTRKRKVVLLEWERRSFILQRHWRLFNLPSCCSNNERETLHSFQPCLSLLFFKTFFVSKASHFKF